VQVIDRLYFGNNRSCFVNMRTCVPIF